MKRCNAILIIGTLLSCAGPATAQGDMKYEAFGSVGVLNYDRSPEGYDFSFGGAFGMRPFFSQRRWLQRLGFDFELNRALADTEGDRTTATANILYHVTAGRNQAYVSVGFGGTDVTCYRPSGGVVGCPRADWASAGAAGLKVSLNERVSLRPEFRVYKGDFGSSGYIYRASLSLGYRW